MESFIYSAWWVVNTDFLKSAPFQMLLPTLKGFPTLNENRSFFATFLDFVWQHYSSSISTFCPLLYNLKGRDHIIPAPTTVAGTPFALSEGELGGTTESQTENLRQSHQVTAEMRWVTRIVQDDNFKRKLSE